MKQKIVSYLSLSVLCLMGLAFLGGLWYYTIGRKPRKILSVSIPAKTPPGTLCEVGQGEVLHVTGEKATLYTLADGTAKWSVALHVPLTTAPAATMTPAPTPPPIAAPTPTPQAAKVAVSAQAQPHSAREKTDADMNDLLAKRSQRRFAKLAEWADKLNAKRANLKTQLQIHSFNLEAAKYHAELAEARAEAAALFPNSQKSVPTTAGNFASGDTGASAKLSEAVGQLEQGGIRNWGEKRNRFSFFDELTEAVGDNGVILLVQGAQASLINRATGEIKKNIALPGDCFRLLRGEGCVFAVCRLGGGTQEVMRIGLADNAMQAVRIGGPPSEGRYQMSVPGVPAEPVIQPLRTELIEGGGKLLQCNVQLIERKITQKALAGAPNSALEEADSKTKSAFGSDAMAYARALALDSAREARGGVEKTDESAYQVALSRPFDPNYPEVRLTVHGRAECFSTRTLDLVTAGRSLFAFDHSGKKLWEATLGNSTLDLQNEAFGSTMVDSTMASAAKPCIEEGERLYFFDSAFLTAFDLSTGQAAWRTPIAGITRLQCDNGLLYVTAGSAELPVLQKIDAKSGKILWRVEHYQECLVSEHQVYVTREVVNAEDAVDRVFQGSKAIQCRWKLYKLAAIDGKPQWEWFQTRRPAHILAHGRKIALLFEDELQVLKSIAL